MQRGLVAAMVEAYPNPRGTMARMLQAGLGEERALVYLFAACGLGFVASLPAALGRAEGLGVEDAVAATVAAHLFGYLMFAPLMLYGLAALAHLAARACGGRGSFLGARTALFWSLLLVAPVALAVAAVAALAPGPWLTALRYAGLGVWIWLFAASLAEAEGFARSGPVAAVVAAAFAGTAALTLIGGGLGGVG